MLVFSENFSFLESIPDEFDSEEKRTHPINCSIPLHVIFIYEHATLERILRFDVH